MEFLLLPRQDILIRSNEGSPVNVQGIVRSPNPIPHKVETPRQDAFPP